MYKPTVMRRDKGGQQQQPTEYPTHLWKTQKTKKRLYKNNNNAREQRRTNDCKKPNNPRICKKLKVTNSFRKQQWKRGETGIKRGYIQKDIKSMPEERKAGVKMETSETEQAGTETGETGKTDEDLKADLLTR